MASFGDILKRERELREISLREISDATKINIRYLEALEQNRFEILPGGLFNKGFIRAYAVYIGLDGEDMVNAYLDEIAVHDDASEADADPLTPGVHRPATSPPRRAAPQDEPGEPPPPYQGESGPPSGMEAAGFENAPTFQSRGLAGSRADLDPGPLTGTIDDQASTPTAKPTKVLVWVFGLIAGVSLLFLALGIFMPRGSASRPGERPSHAPVEPPASIADAPERQQIAAFGSTSEVSLPTRPSSDGEGSEAPPPPETSRTPSTAAPAVATEESLPMDLHLEARGRTWVQVFCDAREAINWVMRSGDSEELRCRDSIRVSATDAAAVRLAVNGASCLPLGESGQRVYGYTLRADDYRLACPKGERGTDGRR
jgi:hypothetical protein